MTAIIALDLENADCSRRWLFAGRADAGQLKRVEPFVGPRSSSFAATLELAGTLTKPSCRPDQRRRSCRRASRAPPAPDEVRPQARQRKPSAESRAFRTRAASADR